jgi:hypothetical protein
MMEVEEDCKQGDLYHELFKQLAHKATESVRHEDIDMLSVCDWTRLNELLSRAAISYINPSMTEDQPRLERLVCVVNCLRRGNLYNIGP